MVWTKNLMVWIKSEQCEQNIYGVIKKFDGVIKKFDGVNKILTVWTKHIRCDQKLDGVIKTFLVWSNVHFLEIVWSHRVVWSFHMFFPDDIATQTSQTNCASGNQSHPRVLHRPHCRSSEGNLGDDLRLGSRGPSGWQRNRETHNSRVPKPMVRLQENWQCIWYNSCLFLIMAEPGEMSYEW